MLPPLLPRVFTGLLLLASLTTCSSKKDDPAPPPAATSGIAWMVDVTSETALSNQVQPSGNNYVSITASGSSGNSSLLLYVPNVVGTYALDNTSFTYARYSASASSTQAFHATSGAIVISSVTATSIAGTFAFRGVNYTGDTRNITKGTFNVTF